ncbi:4650_t:CDS:1, partial [Cetraspora pellucida]
EYRIFKNNDDILLVLEKVKTSNLRMVFVKNNEVIKPSKEYYYEYIFEDKTEHIQNLIIIIIFFVF